MTETSTEDCKRLAQGVLDQLKDISENGLHRVYNSFSDYLWDMYPDLPWNAEGSRTSINMILDNPNFYDIAMKIMDSHEINMLLEFGKAINQTDAEY